MIDKHGSVEGMAKVKRWHGRRVKYFKPKKTIYSTERNANPQRNRVYAQFVDQDGLPINEQKVQQRLQDTFFNTLTIAQNVTETSKSDGMVKSVMGVINDCQSTEI